MQEFQSSLSKESSDLFLAPYSKENILFPNLGKTFPNVKFEKEFGKNPSRNDHFRVILWKPCGLIILCISCLVEFSSFFGLPFTASQYCLGKVFPVWNFPAFYFMHANWPNEDGNQSSFGRFQYYYVNYRTFARL